MPSVPTPELTIEVDPRELAALVGGEYDGVTGILTVPKPFDIVRAALPLRLGEHHLGMWSVDEINSYTSRRDDGCYSAGYRLTLRKVD